MARRDNQRRTRSSRRDGEDENRRGKQRREDKIERITWFLLVMIFGVIYLLPEDTSFPHWIVPVSGAAVLLGSGIFQYVQRMRVSPVTWIGGTVMAMMGAYSFFIAPSLDFLGLALIVFAAVIGIGVLTGET